MWFLFDLFGAHLCPQDTKFRQGNTSSQRGHENVWGACFRCAQKRKCMVMVWNCSSNCPLTCVKGSSKKTGASPSLYTRVRSGVMFEKNFFLWIIKTTKIPFFNLFFLAAMRAWTSFCERKRKKKRRASLFFWKKGKWTLLANWCCWCLRFLVSIALLTLTIVFSVVPKTTTIPPTQPIQNTNFAIPSGINQSYFNTPSGTFQLAQSKPFVVNSRRDGPTKNSFCFQRCRSRKSQVRLDRIHVLRLPRTSCGFVAMCGPIFLARRATSWHFWSGSAHGTRQRNGVKNHRCVDCKVSAPTPCLPRTSSFVSWYFVRLRGASSSWKLSLAWQH